MRNKLKHIFYHLPRPLRRSVLRAYESFYAARSVARLKNEEIFLPTNKLNTNEKMHILFYHISGLSFGGTEKFLQILAKYINKEKYNIYFMYSLKNTNGNRLSYLKDQGIELIEFDYDKSESKYPYFIKGMKPNILKVIEEKNIDLVVTPGSGFNQFPLNVIKNIPIFVLNIFGSPNTQPNIVNNICISHEVADKIRPLANDGNIKVMYIPSEKPSEDFIEKGKVFRASLGLKDTDMVFGRIGRADDHIFDPIAIEAFKIVVKEFPHAHFLIQSPAPILIKKVKDEMIPNVHFLESTSDEEKIWSFHFAIDALAHSRSDGESCGLNIIESMIAGRPVISHKSHIWNAQLEYLEPSFSRIAEKGDIPAYTNYMREFIQLKQTNKLDMLGEKAHEKSKMFLIENNIGTFETWVDELKPDRALITSCSNKFFPGALNLIGSIKNAYPDHPPIFVYDQGLLPVFRKELEMIEGVTVVKIPPFCAHWKSCYTWKTYIFAYPPARLNFYLDSGLQVLKPLNSVFDQIEKDDYLAIAQNLPLERTAPEEYKELFNVEERFYKETYITAGIFGFKSNSKITGVLNDLYEAGIAGLCLGFSPSEAWRNKGKNKNPFVRHCTLFRFDTSVLTLLMRQSLKDFIVSPQETYELGTLLNKPEQLIFNARLNYIKKENMRPKLLFNKIYIKVFLSLKKISNKIKK